MPIDPYDRKAHVELASLASKSVVEYMIKSDVNIVAELDAKAASPLVSLDSKLVVTVTDKTLEASLMTSLMDYYDASVVEKVSIGTTFAALDTKDQLKQIEISGDAAVKTAYLSDRGTVDYITDADFLKKSQEIVSKESFERCDCLKMATVNKDLGDAIVSFTYDDVAKEATSVRLSAIDTNPEAAKSALIAHLDVSCPTEVWNTIDKIFELAAAATAQGVPGDNLVESAAGALMDKNENNDIAALNKIEAFISQCETMGDVKLLALAVDIKIHLEKELGL